MTDSEKNLKVFINGISSPELSLWQPVIKDFISDNVGSLYYWGKDLSVGDQNFLKDAIGLNNIDSIEKVEGDLPEGFLFFVCLASQMPLGFTANDNQHVCCFFGGISSSKLSEQLKSAGEKGVASLYSDLLPCEIKDSIPPEDFEFFKNAHEFLPHAHNETTIETNSNAKSKVLYVRNKIPSSANNALTENILIGALSDKEDFEVLDLSNTDLSDWMQKIWPGENCEKIILSEVSIPLQHFFSDICKVKSIQLQYIFTQSYPSPQRRYLNGNELFDSLLEAAFSSSSVRKRVHDVLHSGNPDPASKPEENAGTMLRYASPETTLEDGPIRPRKLFTDKQGKLEYFRETEHAACEMAFGSSENSYRLKHPYSDLKINASVDHLIVHTLAFLEASRKSSDIEAPFALSPIILHQCTYHCLFSRNASVVQVLLSLFRLEPRNFFDAIIYMHQEERDQNKKLSIVNQILTTLAILEIDHDLKVELYERLRKSNISILLDLFIHLDLNENEEFLALANKAKLGINIIYPLVYYFGTKPREGGLNAEEIDQIFESELQNADKTKLLLITTISKQLAYQKVTSLEYFEGLDSRFSHLFEKCSKSVYQYAILSSINGNSLDKRLLNKFNSANVPYDKILLICAAILLGNEEVVRNELDSLSEKCAKDFLASDLDLRIKLQCLILIRHYFEIGPINDSAILLFKSYDFRHYDLFLKLVESLPKCQTDMAPDQKSILTKIASARIVYAC